MRIGAEAEADTAGLRKARGAFFTPDPIAKFITEWAVRDAADLVLEPSCGDAAFAVQAVDRLRALGVTDAPGVDGVEIHRESAETARGRIRDAGGTPRVKVSDFFLVKPEPKYTAVVGNPHRLPMRSQQSTAGIPGRFHVSLKPVAH